MKRIVGLLAVLSSLGAFVGLLSLAGPTSATFNPKWVQAAGWSFVGIAALVVFVMPAYIGLRWGKRRKRADKTPHSWRIVGWLLFVLNGLWLGGSLFVDPGLPQKLISSKGGWIADFVLGRAVNADGEKTPGLPSPPATGITPIDTSAQPRLPGGPGGPGGHAHMQPMTQPTTRPTGPIPRQSSATGVIPPPDRFDALLLCALRGQVAIANYGGTVELRALPECLTRLDAARAGMALASMTLVTAGVEEIKPGSQATPDKGQTKPQQAAQKQESKAQVQRMTAALAPWGLQAKFTSLTDGAAWRIKDNGRRFLREMAALKEEVERNSKGAQDYFRKTVQKEEERKARYAKLKQPLPFAFRPYNYGDVDPEVLAAFADIYLVGIRFKKSSAAVQDVIYARKSIKGFPLQLVIEDGHWRARWPDASATEKR